MAASIGRIAGSKIGLPDRNYLIDLGVDDLAAKLGTTGDGTTRQLGFDAGIPVWERDESNVAQAIKQSFDTRCDRRRRQRHALTTATHRAPALRGRASRHLAVRGSAAIEFRWLASPDGRSHSMSWESGECRMTHPPTSVSARFTCRKLLGSQAVESACMRIAAQDLHARKGGFGLTPGARAG